MDMLIFIFFPQQDLAPATLLAAPIPGVWPWCPCSQLTGCKLLWSMRYCEEEDVRHQKQQHRRAAIHWMGFHVHPVPKTDHLHASPHCCSKCRFRLLRKAIFLGYFQNSPNKQYISIFRAAEAWIFRVFFVSSVCRRLGWEAADSQLDNIY